MTDTTALIAEATAWRNENPDDPQTELVSERVASLIGRLADALEAFSPQVVGTVEELDALPVGSVVMEMVAEPFLGIPTVEGVFHKFPVAVQEPGRTPDEGWREWFVVAGHGARPASDIALPARVLFRPTREEAQR